MPAACEWMGRPHAGGSDESGQASPPEDAQLASISSGINHTCGLRKDGTAVCWGPKPYSSDFGGWEAPPDSRLISIDSGSGLTCGVEEGGWVRCWGGHSDVGDQVRNTPSEDFVEVSVSRFHSCGVREDGAVVCWGSNSHGEQSSPWGERFTSVSTGHRHSCALRPDHTVACWVIGQHIWASNGPRSKGDSHLGGSVCFHQ